MHFRYTLLIFCFLLFFSKTNAQNLPYDTIRISLDEAWQKAQANSKELKKQHTITQQGEENVLDAKGDRLPDINTGASYGKLADIPIFANGIFNQPEYIRLSDHSVYGVSVNAYFNIYNGSKSKNNILLQSSKHALLKAVEEETTQQLHLKVISTYLTLQQEAEYERLVKENIVQNRNEVDLIKKLYDNGTVLKSDLLQGQLQLSKQEMLLKEIRNNIQLVVQELNIMMGIPDEQPLNLTEDLTTDYNILPYPDYVKEAIATSPLQKMADDNIKISEYQLSIQKADRLPSIALYGDYNYSYPQNRLYPYTTAPYMMSQAGIKVSYKLSSLYKNRHKEQAARINIEEQKTAQLNVEDQLRKEVNKAYTRYQEDLVRITVAQKSIEQSSENYRIVYQTYFNQLSLLNELLDADTQLLQSQFELVSAKIAARSHYYQLLKITGKL